MQQKNGFARQMLALAIPVTLQNLLFSSFTLVDTLMIGALGDVPLAAVGMAGKWTWFLTIVFFGFASGASVFIARFFGAGDTQGIRHTYGLMNIGTLAASAVFMAAALFCPERILSLFSDDAQVIAVGTGYLRIIALSYPLQALARSGGTLLQSTEHAGIPFVAALCSVAVNIALNAVLIFGLLGFPALGVAGAAVASAVSAAVNVGIIYALGIGRRTLLRESVGKTLRFDRRFVAAFFAVSLPALLNETVWALGNLMYSSVFGHMGTGAYASITVAKTIEDLTSVAVMGLCASCAVMIGSAIGRGDMHGARHCAVRHVQLTIGFSLVTGALLLAMRVPLLSLFGVSSAVREDALAVLFIYAVEMTLRNIPSILVMGVFRAGGDTRFGLIVDSITIYLIGLPLTAAGGLWLGLGVPLTYAVMVLSEDIVKCVIYGMHMRGGKWIRPIVNGQ